MIKSTHHVNQVNEITSHLTSTKSKLVNQKELFQYTKFARGRIIEIKIESYINYLNGWLMKMTEEMKYSKFTAKCAVRKASKSSVIIFNRIKRLKYLKLLVRELKE